MRGFIDFWIKAKGYGFIHDNEKTVRYFAHISAVQNDVIPATGNLVEFEPGVTARGPIATNIRVLDKAETIAALSFLGGGAL